MRVGNVEEMVFLVKQKGFDVFNYLPILCLLPHLGEQECVERLSLHLVPYLETRLDLIGLRFHDD